MAFLQTNEMFKRELSHKQHRLTNEELVGVKKVVYEILCDVVAVCKEKNIPYMLGGGSALGAVRHKGFIPWDDDIDLNIERKYIDRLLDEIEACYGGKYYVEAPLRTPGYLSSWVMVHKRGTVFREYLVKSELECGIKIDIFVIENTYNGFIRRLWHGIRSEAGLFALSCMRMYLWRGEFLELSRGNRKATAVIAVKGTIGRGFAGRSAYWYEKVQKCLMECKDGNSLYVTIPSGRGHFWGELYRRKEFLQFIDMPFEDLVLSVTADYDHYLRNLYGEYQTLPPETRREHHVIYEVRV
jgi:lipopolysaccharide cholinephosphotransferase